MENLDKTEHVASLDTPMPSASLEMEKSIAVIDTSRLARAGLVNLLQIMGYDRVHEADDMIALNIQNQDHSNLNVIVIRISTYDVNPKEVMEQVLRTMPDVRVLFLAPYLDIKLLNECFSAGATGYLSESTSQEILKESLRMVEIGDKVFPSELADLLPLFVMPQHEQTALRSECCDGILTERELDILHELGTGQSNKTIAIKLRIAEGTVKAHVKRVLRKISVCNRTQAALWAVDHGMLEKLPESRQ